VAEATTEPVLEAQQQQQLQHIDTEEGEDTQEEEEREWIEQAVTETRKLPFAAASCAVDGRGLSWVGLARLLIACPPPVVAGPGYRLALQSHRRSLACPQRRALWRHAQHPAGQQHPHVGQDPQSTTTCAATMVDPSVRGACELCVLRTFRCRDAHERVPAHDVRERQLVDREVTCGLSVGRGVLSVSWAGVVAVCTAQLTNTPRPTDKHAPPN
jgi:hypothetical protein